MTSFPRAAVFLVLTLCVLAVHWPAERVDFVYDDDGFIVTNPAVHSVAAAARAVFQPFPPAQPGRGLYRPVTALSYGVDFTLWRGNPRGLAITNVVLYLAVVLLAWQFFAGQLTAPRAAFVAALLFAVHPVHTEAVDAIAGRSELLALLFALLSIRWYLVAIGARVNPGEAKLLPTRRGVWIWSFASALAYALACGAKETAVVLPGVLACLGAVRASADRAGCVRWRRAGLPLLPHLLVMATYVVVRLAVLGGLTPLRTVLGGVDLAGRLLTAGSVFLEYLRLLFYPSTLQVDGYYLTSIGVTREPTPQAILGIALLATLLLSFAALAVRIARRASSGTTMPAAAAQGALLGGLAIFIIFLLPVSHLLPVGALMAERFLVAPSLGFALAAAAAFLLLAERLPSVLHARPGRAVRLAGALALALLVALGGWRSRARAQEWRDAVRLWTAADRMIPGSHLVKANLAAELLQRGDLDGAERYLREALAIRPGEPKDTFNLALLAARRGDLDSAVLLCEELLRRNPSDAGVLVELAEIEARRSDPERARHLLVLARPLAAGRADLEMRLLALEGALGKGAR